MAAGAWGVVTPTASPPARDAGSPESGWLDAAPAPCVTPMEAGLGERDGKGCRPVGEGPPAGNASDADELIPLLAPIPALEPADSLPDPTTARDAVPARVRSGGKLAAAELAPLSDPDADLRPIPKSDSPARLAPANGSGT